MQVLMAVIATPSKPCSIRFCPVSIRLAMGVRGDSIVIDGGKDQLLMKGSDFTMVVGGKRHTTSSKSNPQFASFQTVFESILSGGRKDISNLSDLTITPKADSKKAARRMLFSSFVMTIDNSGALRSLRLNERAGYTEYKFTGHQFK